MSECVPVESMSERRALLLILQSTKGQDTFMKQNKHIYLFLSGHALVLSFRSVNAEASNMEENQMWDLGLI